MKRCLASLVALLVTGAAVHAQAPPIGSYSRPGVNPRPTVSPYLNLNRGGSTAINYFGLVRPQIEGQKAIQQLQMQQTELDTMQGQIGQQNMQAAQEIAPTGRPLGGFFNYSHYYPTMNRGGGFAGGVRR